jgi:hypothetical protein
MDPLAGCHRARQIALRKSRHLSLKVTLRAIDVAVSRTDVQETSPKSYPQCEFQRAGYMRHLQRSPCKTARQTRVVALRDPLMGQLCRLPNLGFGYETSLGFHRRTNTGGDRRCNHPGLGGGRGSSGSHEFCLISTHGITSIGNISLVPLPDIPWRGSYEGTASSRSWASSAAQLPIWPLGR